MPDGKLVTYGAPTNEGVQDGRVFAFWDPLDGFGPGTVSISSNAAGVDSFCSSGSILPNGQFLNSGGAGQRAGANSRESSLLNYRTQNAVRTSDMILPRWYGTMTKLPDGKVMTTGGGGPYVTGGFADPIGQAGGVSSTPEVFTIGQGWSLLSGARSLDAFGAENNRYWYPRQWVSPSGTVFGISTDKMWELTLGGIGSIRTVGDFKTDVDFNTRPNVGPTSTAVMFDIGRILQVGGNGYANGFGSPSSATASVIDINGIAAGNVQVRDTAPMNFPRQWANAIVLPDGKVAVTGGTRFADSAGVNDVRAVELWNPETESWTVGPDAAVYRGYHSSAALLPSGAIFSAGGGVPGPVTNFNAELYLPPYLFRSTGGGSVRANRPRIISMSSNSLGYGQILQLETSAAGIREVSLIALPAVTHSFDSNQRRMKLQYGTTDVGVDVVLPTSANLAPPGYYYLSIVDSAGVPSTAVIVAIASEAPPLPSGVTTPIANPTPPSPSPVTNPVDATGSATVRYGMSGQYITLSVTDQIDCTTGAFGGDPIVGTVKICEVLQPDQQWAFCAVENEVCTVSGAAPAPVATPSAAPVDAPAPVIGSYPEITGAFEATADVVFSDPMGGFWQRVFDFGNGPEQDNVLLTQAGNSNDMALHLWQDGVQFDCTAPNSIVAGERAIWQAGITENGLFYIEKNGAPLASCDIGIVPANVLRANKLVGSSNWGGDAPLIGEVFSLTFSFSANPTISVVPPTNPPVTSPTDSPVFSQTDAPINSPSEAPVVSEVISTSADILATCL